MSDPVQSGKKSGHRFGKGNKAGKGHGRPKKDPDFISTCKRITEKSLAKWEHEIDTMGPKWFEASKLAAAYAHGQPTQTISTPQGQGAVAIALVLSDDTAPGNGQS